MAKAQTGRGRIPNQTHQGKTQCPAGCGPPVVTTLYILPLPWENEHHATPRRPKKPIKGRKCARTKILAELGRLSHGQSAGRK